MIALLLSSCLMLAWEDPPPQASRGPAPSPADVVLALETAIADAISAAEDSVVAIHRSKNEISQETLAIRGRKHALNAHQPSRPLTNLDGLRISRFNDSANVISFDFGAGVVIGDRGQIVTMYHVVKGARELVVKAANRQEFRAEIIAADPRSDLAVIAPVEGDGSDAPKLKPVVIGDAAKLRKGSFLIALGNSFNAARDGKPSASWGILSNVARKLDTETDEFGNLRKTLRLLEHPTLFQLDSKLNLGMSGGAVINLKGELVALTTMAASPAGFDAMAGYAIPMDKIGRRAVETLKEGKEIEYGLLGIAPDNHTNRVKDVNPNSPAAEGNVLVNDEIIAVNETPVVDFDSLILAVNAFSAGDTVRLKIRRGENTIERTLVLAKYPVGEDVIATTRPKPWRGLRVDYTSTLSFRAFGRELLDPTLTGVVVTEVDDGSPAAAAGIKKGQFIRKIGDKSPRSPREFYRIGATLKGPVNLETDAGPVTVK